MMRASELTTAELQRTARAVLRAYLDVEAGVRPPEALRPWVGEPADLPHARSGVRPTRHSDIGPVVVLRYGPDRVYAAAAVQQPEEAAASLVAVELSTKSGALRAERIAHIGTDPRQRDAETQWATHPRPPGHLEWLLGPVPDAEDARLRWATAAAVITDYRETYGVEDTASALGPVPDDPEQRRERDRALAYTRQLVKALEAERPRREADRDRPGPDLTG